MTREIPVIFTIDDEPVRGTLIDIQMQKVQGVSQTIPVGVVLLVDGQFDGQFRCVPMDALQRIDYFNQDFNQN